MAVFDITKYRQMFLEEAEELFETIDGLLLEAEDTNDMDGESINSLFRLVHTLKGNSASVELASFAGLTHEIEFFMDRLRNNELEFREGMAELLIDAIDTLKHILELEMSDDLDKDFFQRIKSDLLKKIEIFTKDISENGEAKPEENANDSEDEVVPDKIGTKLDVYGSVLPQNGDSSYGSVLPNNIKKNNFGEINYDDSFGFFDDEEIFGLFDELDESFGFFDEADKDDFGFFDETDEISCSTLDKPNTKVDNDSFGWFCDELEEVVFPEVKLAIDAIAKKDENEQIYTAKISNTNAQTDIVPLEGNVSFDNKKQKTDTSSNSIRVDLFKIDGLMNNIGELVIAHSMLSQYIYLMEDQKIKADLNERLDLIDRHIRELQESVMSVRMIPMGTVFSKFPKVIRDTAKRLDKKIDFKHFGEAVEIDKAMIEGLTDPLMHIVRNALDHGIESPKKRREAGKSESGTLRMSAEQANGQMIIKIQDDGGGINIQRVTAKAIENGVIEEHQALSMTNNEKAMLIFAPGLSTAETVTDISGRGVGMDVVMSNIKKLGGVVEVETEEKFGTTISISLPLTLAILDGLNIRVGQEQFILPLSVIIETLKPEDSMIQHIGDKNSEILMLRKEFIPIIRLHKFFNVASQHQEISDGLLIVVRSAGQKIALFIDEFMNQQQFVIKPLDKNFRNAQGIGGATVRGDGTIGLIIDTMNIMEKNY